MGKPDEVLVEVGGTWRLCISEFAEAPFSHIAEAGGIRTWPHDTVTASGSTPPG